MRSDKFWAWFDSEAKPHLGGRAETFTKMFEYLDTIERPVGIVETGCAMDRHPTAEENWNGDGRSTVMFDQYVKYRKGVVYAVDINPQAVNVGRTLVSRRTKIHCGDSVAFLRKLASKPPTPLRLDLLYLDSFDLLVSHPVAAASHHLNELMAIMPLVTDETLVVVDDAPQVFHDTILPRVEIGGKAMFVAKHAEQVGAEMQFYQYQVGWLRMNGRVQLPSGYGNTVPFTDAECERVILRCRSLVEKGHNIEAEPLYRLILGRTTPPGSGLTRVAHAEACHFYARLAVAKGRYGTATDWYREALQADPRDVEGRCEMVVKALRPMANWRIAQQEMVRATKIEPENHHAWRTLGGIEHELGNVDSAVACYDRQLELIPDDPHAMLDRCTIAMDVADYDRARGLLNRVMETDRAPDALHCLAMIAYREGRHEEAIEGYKKAIEAGCHDAATAHWNMSLALHSIGRYREGWVEHEWRKHEANSTALSLPMLRFVTPMWAGEPAPARLHVHAEAGMGDNIAMARYLPILVERGYEVTYETYPEMLDLMARSFPSVRVITRAADYPGAIGIPPHDFHIPIGSLPAVLGTDIDSVPWNGPYLTADKFLFEYYRENMGPRKRIGLCWSSGIRDSGIWLKEYGKRKSMGFDTMHPIWMSLCDDFHFVSLQVGPERAENDGAIADVLPAKPTWDDTCALISQLNLVITVDTAVAHAAGAMGKPVWVLVQNDAQSWHWMAERPGSPWNTASPWYPTARLFRQHEVNRPHYWDDVIADVARELELDAPCLNLVRSAGR